ncbi:MAG: tetraacyldisaccharide 4'-kinase [Deferrisomatales bacterium]|nr:tetraacyldisaccharide 4'-kinase [Deferrisomatales bacterium]
MTGLYFWVRDLLSRRAVGWVAEALFLPLSVPAWGYGKVQALRRWAYGRGLLRTEHPGVPVISVGNIAAGGTGKTPCVETVCRLLLAAGVRPAVLSRGYLGSLQGAAGVVSDGSRVRLSPESAGDEPVLLARRLPGVPVVVGRDRRETARLAVQRFGVEVLVLDDGFQHLPLARDLDVVLLDARHPFGNGYCFPRGLLREGPGALAEADLVLLTRTRRADSQRTEAVTAAVRRYNPSVPVLTTAHAPLAVVDLATGEVGPLESLRGLKVLAFAGIGTPEAFFRELGDLGAKVLQAVPFRDHHRYTPADVEQVTRWAGLMNAQALVTTEKDGVRLLGHLPLPLPVLALRIEMLVLDRPEEFRRQVLAAAGRA